MAQVEQAAEAYQPLVDWLSQNSAMMFSCICDSITTEIFAKVNTDPSRYRLTVPENLPTPAYTVSNGPCFLKVIIDDTYANTTTNIALA